MSPSNKQGFRFLVWSTPRLTPVRPLPLRGVTDRFFFSKVTKMSFSARGALHFLINSYKEAGKIKRCFTSSGVKKKHVPQFSFYNFYPFRFAQLMARKFCNNGSNRSLRSHPIHSARTVETFFTHRQTRVSEISANVFKF